MFFKSERFESAQFADLNFGIACILQHSFRKRVRKLELICLKSIVIEP